MLCRAFNTRLHWTADLSLRFTIFSFLSEICLYWVLFIHFIMWSGDKKTSDFIGKASFLLFAIEYWTFRVRTLLQLLNFWFLCFCPVRTVFNVLGCAHSLFHLLFGNIYNLNVMSTWHPQVTGLVGTSIWCTVLNFGNCMMSFGSI